MLRIWKHSIMIGMLAVSLGAVVFYGCNKDGGENATTAVETSTETGSYMQTKGGSTVFTLDGATYQLNFAVGAWTSFPFGEWWYVELNQQQGEGKAPGQKQVPVMLTNPVLSLDGVPTGVTALVVALKTSSGYAEQGTFPVKNGHVDVSIAQSIWEQRFGKKQLALWLKTVGGQNFTGQSAVTLTLRGKLPEGSQIKGLTTVTIALSIALGVNPVPTPAPVVPITPSCKASGVPCINIGTGPECCSGICGTSLDDVCQ